MSNVTVNIGTYCNVTASYDGITLSVTAEVLPAVIQQQTDWNETNTDAASYLKNKPNTPDADTVGNDTTPANTDRNYFFSALTGWFYLTWEKLRTLLSAGSGAFAQPVYLINTASDVEGYKVLSYDNDASLTEVVQSTADEANVYLYPAGLDIATLPAGPYFFRFRAKVNATVGDTFLRITSFVRDNEGNETTLFTSDTEIINSTSYVDVGVRAVQPAFSVNATDRFGIRVLAVTTHTTAKTVTYQVGDGYSAYFTTPVALRHDLLRGRDEANSHPSDAISNESDVSGETVTDALNNLQAINRGYEAASFEVIQGGTVTGDISGVQHDNDGSVLRVNEATGGLTVDFTFTGVESFNFISMHLRYVGGANHVWDIQLYNNNTADWDTIGETIGTQDELTWFNISVPQFQNYLNAGEVKVRFYHLPNFIASHYVLFDYVAVVASITAASPTASSITVSDPVTPDFTPAEQGDNMQDITNKVAGLQGLTYRKLYEIELTDPIAFIDITKDLDGNDLDLRVGFKVSYYLLADVDSNYISGIQINGITDDVYEFSSLFRNYLIWYGTRFGSSGGISLNINGKNPDVTLHCRQEYGATQPGTIAGNATTQRIRQNIQSVISFRLLTDGYLAGSKIVIYGA